MFFALAKQSQEDWNDKHKHDSLGKDHTSRAALHGVAHPCVKKIQEGNTLQLVYLKYLISIWIDIGLLEIHQLITFPEL
jgi:hypothetical protein